MSETNDNNLPQAQNNEQTKDFPKTLKYITGVVLGLLTTGGIMLSGAISEGTINIKDQLLSTIASYSWVIFFGVFMIGVRQVETKREISLKETRTAYLITIALFVVVMLVVNLTGTKIGFGV